MVPQPGLHGVEQDHWIADAAPVARIFLRRDQIAGHRSGHFVRLPVADVERPKCIAGRVDAAALAIARQVALLPAPEMIGGPLRLHGEVLLVDLKPVPLGFGQRQQRRRLMMAGETLAFFTILSRAAFDQSQRFGDGRLERLGRRLGSLRKCLRGRGHDSDSDSDSDDCGQQSVCLAHDPCSRFDLTGLGRKVGPPRDACHRTRV